MFRPVMHIIIFCFTLGFSGLKSYR